MKESDHIPSRRQRRKPLTPPGTHSGNRAVEPPMIVDSATLPRKAWYRDKDIREIILIVATITLAMFTGWMAWETRQLAKEGNAQAVATQKSVAIAESSLSMLKSSAAFSEKTAKMDIRPYVAFDKISQITLSVGQMVSVRVVFINAGKSPAYGVRTVALFKLAIGLYDQDYSSLDQGATPRDEGTIGAGQTAIELLHFRVLSTTDSIAIATRTSRLLLLGRILYKDKFGERHVTHYAWLYNPALTEWVAYDRYNDAD